MFLGQLNKLTESIGEVVNTSPTPLLKGIVGDITETDQFRGNRDCFFIR